MLHRAHTHTHTYTQATPAATTYEVRLDGASAVPPREWEGAFNAVQVKAFEGHSHWRPLFSRCVCLWLVAVHVWLLC